MTEIIFILFITAQYIHLAFSRYLTNVCGRKKGKREGRAEGKKRGLFSRSGIRCFSHQTPRNSTVKQLKLLTNLVWHHLSTENDTSR